MRWSYGWGAHPKLSANVTNQWRFDSTTNVDIVQSLAVPSNGTFTNQAPTNGGIDVNTQISSAFSTPWHAGTGNQSGSVTFRPKGSTLATIRSYSSTGTNPGNLPFNDINIFLHGNSTFHVKVDRATADGPLRIVVRSGGQFTFWILPQGVIDNWVNLTWVFQNGAVRIYVNGAPLQLESAIGGASAPTGAGPHFFANQNPPPAVTAPWQWGQSTEEFCFADTTIWNTALSRDEVVGSVVNRIKGIAFPSCVKARFSVERKNSDAEVDFSTMAGHNWIQKIVTNSQLDKSTCSATVTLCREIGGHSINPYIEGAFVNNYEPSDGNTAGPGSYRPILVPDAKYKIEIQRVGFCMKAVPDQWQSQMEGCIDEVNPGSGDTVTITARSQEGWLVDTYHEQEVLNPGIDPEVRDRPGKQPSYGAIEGEYVGQTMRDVLLDNSSATIGSKSVSDHIYFSWTDRKGSYPFNANGDYDLHVPYFVNWYIRPYRQKKEPVMAILERLAQQAACRVRFRWIDDRWRLTLWQPLKSDQSIALHLKPLDILDVQRFSSSNNEVRNVVRSVYVSQEGRNRDAFQGMPQLGLPAQTTSWVDVPDWLPQLSTLPVASLPEGIASINALPLVSNSQTVRKYEVTDYAGEQYLLTHVWHDQSGESEDQIASIELENITRVDRPDGPSKRRFMETSHASQEQINTAEQNLQYVWTILHNVQDADADFSVQLPPMPELELNDIIYLAPNHLLHSSAQQGAISSIQTTYGGNFETTSISLRARKAVGHRRWLSIEAGPGGARPPIVSPFDATSDLETGPGERIRRWLIDRGMIPTNSRLHVPNSRFDSMQAKRLPPDGWNIENNINGTVVNPVRARGAPANVAPTWCTNGSLWQEDATWGEKAAFGITENPEYVLSGHRSVVINPNGIDFAGRLYTDPMPLDGSALAPLSVKLDWARTAENIPLDENNSLGFGVRVDLQFYSSRRLQDLVGVTSVFFNQYRQNGQDGIDNNAGYHRQVSNGRLIYEWNRVPAALPDFSPQINLEPGGGGVQFNANEPYVYNAANTNGYWGPNGIRPPTGARFVRAFITVPQPTKAREIALLVDNLNVTRKSPECFVRTSTPNVFPVTGISQVVWYNATSAVGADPGTNVSTFFDNDEFDYGGLITSGSMLAKFEGDYELSFSCNLTAVSAPITSYATAWMRHVRIDGSSYTVVSADKFIAEKSNATINVRTRLHMKKGDSIRTFISAIGGSYEIFNSEHTAFSARLIEEPK